MPYVCAPGRSQVDGQCSALREKEEPRSCTYVQPATTPPSSSALCDLSPDVCDYLNRNSWIKSDPCRGDDRRSRCATPSPLSCWELFLEKRVSIATLFDSMRPASYTSQISLQLGSVLKTSKIDSATEMDSSACQPRAIDDRIAWQFTQPAF